MKLNLDLDLLRRIDRELPYLTVEAEEIEAIRNMASWKLVEASLPDAAIDGSYTRPAVVHRIRPRGTAALENDGDTMI